MQIVNGASLSRDQPSAAISSMDLAWADDEGSTQPTSFHAVKVAQPSLIPNQTVLRLVVESFIAPRIFDASGKDNTV